MDAAAKSVGDAVSVPGKQAASPTTVRTRQARRPAVAALYDRRNHVVRQIVLKLVCAMGAENEFELQKHGIDVTPGQEKCLVQEVVIIL